jgi:hypothetical protein
MNYALFHDTMSDNNSHKNNKEDNNNQVDVSDRMPLSDHSSDDHDSIRSKKRTREDTMDEEEDNLLSPARYFFLFSNWNYMESH